MIPFTADRAMIAKFDAAIQPFMSKLGTMGEGVKGFQLVSTVGFSDVEQRANRTGQALVNLRNNATALGAIGAAAGIGAMTLALNKLNDRAVTVDNQLQAIGISTDSLKKKVFALAIETRTPVEATVELLARMQKSLQGQPIEQTIRQVGTLNRLLAIGGLDTNARASVSLQFGQALQSGVLQGDELRSLREAAPFELLDAIAKAAGGTVEQLRDLGSEGKLTRDVMVKALDDLESASRDKLGKFALTLQDASEAMSTGMLAVIGSVNEGLGTYETLAAVQQGIGTFMLENADAAETLGRALRMVFEASLLLAGTRGLMLLGGSLQAVVASMTAARGAAILTTAAMGAMRGMLALFGGPVGLALFAAGAAFIALRRSIVTVNDALEATGDHLGKLGALKGEYSGLVDEIAADLKRLKDAQDAVTASTDAQGSAARSAAAVEIAAIEDLLAKNRELLSQKAALARFELEQGEKALQQAKDALTASISTSDDPAPGLFWRLMSGSPVTAATGLEDRQAANAAAFEAEVNRKIAAGQSLTEAESTYLRRRIAVQEREAQLAKERAALSEVEIAARDKLARVMQTGGDASVAEAIYAEQAARAREAEEAIREMSVAADALVKKRQDFGQLQDQMDQMGRILDSYQFDGDGKIRAGFDMVAEAIKKASRNIDGLDDQELDNLRKQVEGIIGLFDRFLSSLGLVRSELSAPYDFYNRFGEAFPGSTDRGAWARNAQEAAGRGILDLIGYAEGTDKGRGYNETLGYGAFTGGPVNLTSMSINDVLALQKRMLAHPDNTYNSSAVGRYQIVSKTLSGLVQELGLSGNELFDERLQDRMAMQLVRRRMAQGTDGFRNEWEGLRNVPPSTITDALSAQSIPAMDSDVAARLKDEAETRKDFNETMAETLERRELEASLIGKTDAEQAKAIRRFELMNDAKRRGIDLDEKIAGSTRTYRQMIEELAEAEAEAVKQEEALGRAKETTEEILQNSIKGKDYITSMFLDGATAAEQLEAALKKALVQLILFNEGAFAVQGGGKGLLGGLGGGIFSFLGSLFADGGIMTPSGPANLPVRAYSVGGIANSPQLAVFGEGDMAEAYVPLPDGRTIPVTLRMPDLSGMDGLLRDRAAASGQPQVIYVPQPYIAEVGPDDSGRLTTHVRRVSAETSGAAARAQERAMPDYLRDMQRRGV